MPYDTYARVLYRIFIHQATYRAMCENSEKLGRNLPRESLTNIAR